MKQRGKIQTQLVEWAGMLPPLDEKRKEWAKHLFKPQALYYSRRGNNCEFWCQCCGAIVPTLGKWLLADYAIDKWVCPECGAECEVLPQYSGGWDHNYNPKTGQYSKRPQDYALVTLADVYKGVQVFRTFEVNRWNRRNGNDERGRWRTMPTKWCYEEVWQNWVFENGKEYITSKSYTRSPFSFNWNYVSGYGIAHHNGHCGGQYVMEDVFELSDNYYFPGKRILPILRRNGLKAKHI